MHQADKAVLRLAIGMGLGLAVLAAYGLALQTPFLVCVMAVIVLCKPGPPIPFFKAVVIALVLAALLAAGTLMVPLLENYSHAFFPDTSGLTKRGGSTPTINRDTANWIALRDSLVVTPVFVLALTDPSFYLAAIMKTVALGQQAGSTNARSAGQELVGFTLMGAGWLRWPGSACPYGQACEC
jgi:hypothetical protein